MDEFYGRWADLNGDGEIDNFEKLVEMEEMDRMDKYISGDDDERREALEDSGTANGYKN